MNDKKCPHCNEKFWRKDKKGKDYKVAEVICPLCDCVFCVCCMPFKDGYGRCPNCLKKEQNENLP